MNIDLTIVYNDQMLTISIDKATTSHYLLSFLKKKKELNLAGDYFLVDFYTLNTINCINESGKMLLLPQYLYDNPKKKKDKKVPIEQLIQKVTKGKKVLEINEEDYYKPSINSSKKYTSEANDGVIEIMINKDCLDQIMQQYSDLDISPEMNDGIMLKENSGFIIESDLLDGENTIHNEIVQNSISNYVYSIMIANNRIVSRILFYNDFHS